MSQCSVTYRSNILTHLLKKPVLILGLTIICTLPFLFPNIAQARSEHTQVQQTESSTTTPSPPQPDRNSQLVVLLDRSGSLVAGETTDPEGYSGSVTNALAELWPGNIAIIPFGNDKADILGNRIFAHSNTADLKTLKNLVDGTFPPPSDANTPLGLAMDRAQSLFNKEVPACSKIVLITDGQPTGRQALPDHITKQSQWFHDHNIPVDVFALKINDATNPDAKQLLNTIATTTNGEYTPVANATDLASSVIGRYSTWRGMSFSHITENTQNGNYAIPIDDNVTQATIITFHPTSITVGQLQGNNGAAIPQGKVLTTADKHYQMDNLVSPILPGIYTITASDSTTTSVYALIDSPLKVAFTNLDKAYIGQAFTIQAHFINAQGSIVVKGQSKVTATITEAIHGTVINKDVVITLHQLAPGSDIFTGDYFVPSTNNKLTDQPQLVGSLSINLNATYGSVTRNAATNVDLHLPSAPPCTGGLWKCQVTPNLPLILQIGIPSLIFLFLLILLISLLRQPQPHGYLTSKRNGKQIQLSDRSLWNKLFHRTTISSDEIANHSDAIGAFSFGLAQFEITSRCKCKKGKHPGKNHIKRLSKETPIKLRRNANMMDLNLNEFYFLQPDDVISINGEEKAVYNLTRKSGSPQTKQKGSI